MPLQELSLKNFKRHADLTLTFDTGMNVMVGENFAGKSTVLQGISYALYGPSAVPGGLKAARTYGSRKKPVVSLSFNLSEKNYQVVRSGSSAKLLQGEDMVASGQSSVTKSLGELLGMDAKTYRLLRTSPQDESQAILTLGSTKLGHMVNQITRIDLVDQVISLAKAEGASIGDIPEPYDTKELNQTCSDQESALVEDHARLQTLVEQQEESRKSMELATQEARDLQIRKSKATQAQEHKNLLEQRRHYLERELTSAPPEQPLIDTDILSAGLAEIRAKLEIGRQAREHRRVLAARLQELETSGQAMATSLNSLPMLAEVDPEVIATLTQDVQERQAKYYQSKASLDVMETALETLEKHPGSATCPTCQQACDWAEAIKEAKARISVGKSETDVAMDDLRQYQEILIQNKRRESDYQDRVRERDIIRNNISVNQQAVERAKLDLEAHSGLSEQEQEELSQREQSARKEMSVRMAENQKALENNSRVSSLKEELAGVDGSLKELPPVVPVTQAQLEEAWDMEKACRDRYAEAELEVVKVREGYTHLYKEWQQNKTQLNQQEDANKSNAVIRSRSKLLNRLVKYLRSNRDRFVEDTWNTLLQYATQFASLSSNGKIIRVGRSADGDFVFDEGEGMQDIICASGIQKAIIGVGVRLSLAESLGSNADFMLLDEVTAGARDEIALAMTQALGASGLQILTVSHRQSDAAVADRVIEIG